MPIDTAASPRLSRSVTVVLAVACGLTVANLYYSQPLLDLIARDFDVSRGAAAVVVTVTQAGYALGLLFVLPLGDLLENRTLAGRTLLGTARGAVELAHHLRRLGSADARFGPGATPDGAAAPAGSPGRLPRAAGQPRGAVRHEPVLRRRALSQATMFGAFSAFWTAVAYQLIAEHDFSQGQIAIFALVGAGGAAAACCSPWPRWCWTSPCSVIRC